MQIILLVSGQKKTFYKENIQHTHKAALWCCDRVPRSSEELLSLFWARVWRDCSLGTLLWGFFEGKRLLGDQSSRRWGPLRSGGMRRERRDLFTGGAEVPQSVWFVESCFSKTFSEPSVGESVTLTESTSGKSCAVAQKAASYSPNACSRVVELSLNGEGAFPASLCWNKEDKKNVILAKYNYSISLSNYYIYLPIQFTFIYTCKCIKVLSFVLSE